MKSVLILILDDAMQFDYTDDALFTAAAFGDNELISELAETSQSNSVNSSDDLGATALFWAVWARRLTPARLLLELGAAPNIANLGKCDINGLLIINNDSLLSAGEFPLHIAADCGDVAMVDLLLQFGANARSIF